MKNVKKLIWSLVFLGYAGVIFHFSIAPIEGEGMVFRLPAADKLLHAGQFTLFVLLGYHAVKYFTRGKTTLPLLFLISGFYGTITELSQTLVPYRHASIWDWIANLIGALLGIAIILTLRRTKDKPLISSSEEEGYTKN